MTKQAALAMCLSAGNVMVEFDPRVAGVMVPTEALNASRMDYCCRLEYGFAFATPMEGFEVNDRGIKAVLSFDRRRFETFVPWVAVFSIGPSTKESRTLWWDDVPPEVGAFAIPRPERRNAEVV